MYMHVACLRTFAFRHFCACVCVFPLFSWVVFHLLNTGVYHHHSDTHIMELHRYSPNHITPIFKLNSPHFSNSCCLSEKSVTMALL